MNDVQSIMHSLVLMGPYGKEEEAEEEAAAATPSPISGIAPGSFDTVEEILLYDWHAFDCGFETSWNILRVWFVVCIAFFSMMTVYD